MANRHESGEKPALEALNVETRTVEELVDRLRDKGITQAEANAYCTELIRRFEPLLRSAWKKGGFEVGYQDYAQDVFVQLFAHLDRLRAAKAFPGYLWRITRSVAANHARRQQRSIEPTALKDIEPQVAAFEEEIHTKIFIRYHLEHLPPRERQVVELIFLGGVPVAEIAVGCSITPGAVRSAKARGLRKLKARMVQEAEALEAMYENVLDTP